MDFFSLGIDIGGTNISWGVVNRFGDVIKSYSWKTSVFFTINDLADKIYSTVYSDFDKINLAGIGIGAPAADPATGCIVDASNLPWKGIVPIVDIFSKKFNTDVRLENDARAAAWGEKIYGLAKNMNNFAFITLGTGVGCGLVINNKLYSGENKYAGEIGHIITYPHGRQCGCGRKGCLETYVSTSGIASTYNEISNSNNGVNNAYDVYLLAQNNDEFALKTFDFTAETLSYGLAQLITIAGIKNIFLFGGPVNAGDILMQPLKMHLKQNILHLIKDFTIQHSGVPKKFAAILGAAALTHREEQLL